MSAVAPGATCRVTRGFFVLRPCAQPAVAACPQCARALCEEHVVTTEAGVRCPECAAQASGTTDPRVDPQWALRYRRGYYESAATGLGTTNDLVGGLFSVFDLFGFSESSSESSGGDYDDDRDAGFFDS